jgi:hypothetical protein
LRDIATTSLEPKTSLTDFEKEVNALLFTSMKEKKDIKVGFELTDINSDNNISRSEDSDANELANKFKLMDSYKPASSSSGVPDEVEDKRLDKWELNDKIPMW